MRADHTFGRVLSRGPLPPAGRDCRPAEPGALLWEDRLDAGGFEIAGSPLIISHTLITTVCSSPPSFQPTERISFLRAHDIRTGALLWEREDAQTGACFVATATDGRRLFVAGNIPWPGRGRDWLLRAHDPTTGGVLWEDIFDYAGGNDFPNGRALVMGERTVFLGGYGTTTDGFTDWIVRAYDAQSGGLLWHDQRNVAGDNDGVSAMALTGQQLIVGGWGDTAEAEHAVLRALDRRSGALLWEHMSPPTPKLGITYVVEVKVLGSGVYTAENFADLSVFRIVPTVRAFDARTGAPLWQQTVETGDGDWLYGIDVDAGRVLTVGEGGPACAAGQCAPVIRSYDAANGALQWARQVHLSNGFDAAHRVTVHRGVAFVHLEAAKCCFISSLGLVGHWIVHAYDIATGDLLWEHDAVELGSLGHDIIVAEQRWIVLAGTTLHAGGGDAVVRVYDARGR